MIKKVGLAFLFGAVAGFRPLAAQSPSPTTMSHETLSLTDCISRAKANNLTLIEAKSAVDQARADLTAAYAAFYPAVNLSGGYQNGNGDSAGNYSAGVGLSYSLYRGGYARAAVRSAQARVQATEADYRTSESEVVLSVKQAFFGILQKQEQIGAVDDVLKRRKEDLAVINLKYKGGTETSPAVKEAEVNVAQGEYDKLRADEELRLAKVSLNLLIGRQRSAEVALSYQEETTAFPPIETMIGDAQKNRPEINAEFANRDALAAQVDQAKSGYLPTVSLSSSANLRGNNFRTPQTGWSAGVNLGLPIFDGFAIRSRVLGARLAAQNEEIKIESVKQNIEEEIEQALSIYMLAEKNLQIAELSLAAEEAMYQLTRLQYEQGLTDYFYFQTKENTLTQASYGRVTAQYNLRTSRAQLLKAWGGGSQ